MAERHFTLTRILETFCEELDHPLCSLIQFEDYQDSIRFHSAIIDAVEKDDYNSLEDAKDNFVYRLQSMPEEKRLVLLTLFFALFLHEVSIPNSPMAHLILRDDLQDLLQNFLEDPDIQPYSLNKECTTLMMKSLYVEQCRLNRAETEGLQDEFLLKLEGTMNRAYRLHWTSIRERMNIVKEELMAAAWHPRRIEKLLEEGGWEAVEGM
jgi:hypothetical protein